MVMMTWSPIPLFAGLAVIDSALMSYEYRIKLKRWVIPKCWILNQLLCLMAYASLIFFSNMKAGIILCSVFVGIVLISDCYVHYREYKSCAEKAEEYKDNNFEKIEHNFSI